MIRNLALLGALAIAAGCASQSADTTGAASNARTNASLPVVYKGAPPGWTAKQRSGEVVYCKKVDVTGSMFPRETCLYPEDLDVVLRKQKEGAQRTLDRPKTNDIDTQ
jgi:hypothetical protein